MIKKQGAEYHPLFISLSRGLLFRLISNKTSIYFPFMGDDLSKLLLSQIIFFLEFTANPSLYFLILFDDIRKIVDKGTDPLMKITLISVATVMLGIIICVTFMFDCSSVLIRAAQVAAAGLSLRF